MVVYKGICACCGAGKNSKRMNAYPAGYPIPDDFSFPVPNQSAKNNRICKDCSVRHFKSKNSNASMPKKRSAAIREITPRKKRANHNLEVALANRSQSVQICAQLVLPAEIVGNVSDDQDFNMNGMNRFSSCILCILMIETEKRMKI